LNAHMQREFSHELNQFEVDKRIANMVCDMGFVLQDNSDDKDKLHRLVKRTKDNLIIVTYEIRSRVINVPNPTENPE
jgi:hypothetical protein